jgi:hypothetical protein
VNPEDSAAQDMIDFHSDWNRKREELEQTVEWQTDNMEYDLRTSEVLIEKVKTREEYAQNLYAAMCNTEFIKNETWNILQDKTWSCSWRSSGGIVANMCEKGDYIDWYCSGIRNDWSDEEFHNATKEEQERYIWMKNNFVGEGYVTDEVRKDLFDLGWIVKENSHSDYI